MARTGILCRCTRLTNFVVLASLLILAALCIAQDANQNPAEMSANMQDANFQAAPAEPNTAAAPETESNAVILPSQPATEVSTGNAAVVVPGTAEANQPVNQADVLTPIEQRMRKTVSVEFRETPIADVVRQLGAQADVDIILSPKVQGNVTATLTDVPLDEALNNILAVHGASYVAGKNMIRIVPISELTVEQAKMVTRVYRIMYADVKDVASALDKFVSKNGQLSFSIGTSNIIVTDTEDKIKSIDTFIKEIDRITPQILVEAKVYDISSDDRLDLGIQWTAGRNTNFGETGSLGSLDKSGKTSPFITGAVTPATNFTNVSGAQDQIRFGVLNNSVNIDAILSAKQRGISAKLLANPRVMVLDNEKANIKIIQEVPYQELSQTAGGGNIGTTQFKEVGVELVVTPHITEEGLVRMHLKPSFSTKGDSLLISVPGTSTVTSVPAINKRETDTIALVRDGDTVVLGGLRERTINKEVDKVPLLGDIPLIGLLFRFQGEQFVNSELVVFVTPTIKATQLMSERDTCLLEQTGTCMPQPAKKLLLDKLNKN